MPYATLAILAASLGSLVAAALFQKFFDADPCILCIFQRIPYSVALFLSALAFLLRNRPCPANFLMILCGLAFLSNVGIAAFHSGVERGWWTGTESCAVAPLNVDPASMTTADLLMTGISDCDEIPFEILGLSLANINVFFCLGLAVLAFVAAFGLVRKEDYDESCCCTGSCSTKK